MIILGIESSCDETAASIIKDGTHILSSIIASQIDVHHKYGGVVPEIASRMHVEAIGPVVDEAIKKARIRLSDIDAVAATRGPGLIGALLVGFSFAKAFAWARKIPLAGVNHLEAHIYSLFLMDHPPEFPFITLVVSGGHTNIYHVTSFDQFELMGQTRDDAAGEAFDKVAKMLGLGYPGGPVIERLAKTCDPDMIKFPRPLLEKNSFDFSFSGLKSAVARFIHDHEVTSNKKKARIAASFQEAVIDVVATKLIRAAKAKTCSRIAITGGVSANQTLIQKVTKSAKAKGITTFAPPIELCGDNAAMIAARGHRMIQLGNTCCLGHDVFSRTRI
ncbi:MAG: tRNA (adenosine(37)-N6)-threonylcarbamoyltransferase complex transferase subunit TsaD [Desulfobacula sp.]|nr:tRNA (adenosine(37)-N6)-threonylcarbamoyltransferase complex transferase subunit TsaD [Desulfobacula sp.]